MIKKAGRKIYRGVARVTGYVARPIYRLLGLDVARIAGIKARVRVDPFTRFGNELLKYSERPTEAFTVPLMKLVLGAGDVYMDVGAHWGIYSIVASELVGPTGRVLSVEPTRQNRARLLDNIAFNSLSNVIVESVAIGASDGRGAVAFRGDSGNLSALVQSGGPQSGGPSPRAGEQSCDDTTLRTLLDRHHLDKVALMKMDIEGGECVASRDVYKYADRFECIYIELHPPFPNPADDSEFLYKMLGHARHLFVVDQVTRRFVRINNVEEFRAKLGLYYFVSARAESTSAPGAVLENFHW